MNKKNIVLYIIVFLIGFGISFGITTLLDNNKKDNKDSKVAENYDTKKLLSGGQVGVLNEYTGEIPDFAMPVRGSYTGTFTDEDLKSSGIKVYEFQGSLKFFFGDVESKYIGIKFKDFLDYYHIENYTKVTFNDFNRLTVAYIPEEVDDNAFLIIKRGEKPIVDKFLAFVDFTYAYNYSIEAVLSVVFD